MFGRISDLLFDIEHISGKYKFVSDFLSLFSSDNKDEEPIPYLTDTSSLINDLYMSYLDDMCANNYDTQQGYCTQHSFPLTRSQSKVQKIVLPSLFKSGKTATGSPTKPPSVLRDPPLSWRVKGLQQLVSLCYLQVLLQKEAVEDLDMKQSTNHPIRAISDKAIYSHI